MNAEKNLANGRPEEKDAQQEFLRRMIHSSADAIIGIDVSYCVVSWNPSARILLGYNGDEVLGKPIARLATTATSDELSRGIDAAFKGERVAHFETEWKTSSGTEVSISLSVSAVIDIDKRVLGISCIARDITARKKQDTAMRSASQYARSLIEASLDPLVTISTDGKITDVNEAAIKITGLPRHRLIGTDFSDSFTDSERAREGYKQVFSTGAVTDYPLTLRHADGRLVDVLYNASVYRDASQKVIGVFAAARDVTAQKQASEYARSLIEASLDPLLTISIDGKITDVNQATIAVTGVDRLGLIGTDFSDYFTEPAKAREGYKKVFEEGYVTDYPLTIRHREGRLVDVLYNASVYKDSRNRVLGVFAAARDVTAQKQASQYFRSLIEASLDPLVTISGAGIITDVNEATIEVTGVERSRLIGTDFSDYFTEPEKARQGYKRVFEEGFVTDYPLTIRNKERLIDVLYNASVYRDSRNNVIGVFAAARDVTAQKQASLYARSLIDASLDPLVTISAAGKITDVNEATVKVTGVTRNKLIGADFSDYFTEPEKAREGYKQVFEKGFVTDYALTIRHSDGKLTDVLYNASVYKDTRGNVLGVFAAARDVTDQNQASQYSRSLIEASLDPFVTINTAGKITDVNEASVLATGLSRENLIGTDFSDYFTEPEKARAGYTEVFEKGAVSDYPLTLRHRNGRLADVLYNASVYRDARGDVLGVFAAARDVTAQKQASQYARSLVEASLDPLVTISPEGKITDVNEATIKVTGVSRRILIGTDFSDYFTDQEKARDGYLRVFSKGYVTDYPLTIRHSDGTLTAVLYNASVYKDVRGNVLGVFAAARDVTAQKTAEAEVADQRKKELERLVELERFQKLTVGRELKMIELKRQLEDIRSRADQ